MVPPIEGGAKISTQAGGRAKGDPAQTHQPDVDTPFPIS